MVYLMAGDDQRRRAAALLERVHDEFAAATLSERWQPTPDPEANHLLAEDPFAFLLAVIADYGVPAERAWVLPFKLREKLGHLDPRLIAFMDPGELATVLRQIPSGHRFPNMLAKFFLAASNKVFLEYGGDAAGVWKGRTARDAYFHLGAFLSRQS